MGIWMKRWLGAPAIIGAVFYFCMVGAADADQHKFAHYNTTFRNLFWSTLYPDGGYDFYCGTAFITPRQASFSPKGMTLEHAYAAQWVVDALGCGKDRVTCRKNNVRFGVMEADMHNLFPAEGAKNSSRGDLLYGLIDGESRKYGACDYERDGANGVVEPRPLARGNFARAIFYMATEYGLPVDTRMLPILFQWNQEDPVNGPERARNDAIEKLQGTRNPFIDNPGKVDALFLSGLE